MSKEKFHKWLSLNKGSCLNNQEVNLDQSLPKVEEGVDPQPELEEEAEDDYF
jgi:hypothetical protein